MPETPHYAFQHAAQWWLTQALRNASGLLTTNLSEACMVWLDMCEGPWLQETLCRVHAMLCWMLWFPPCCGDCPR